MPVLMFTGGTNPFNDIEGFVANAKTKFPGITDQEIRKLIKRAVGRHQRRMKRRVITLFGHDIMTADIEQIPAWPYLSRSQRLRVTAHPIDAGERVDHEKAKISRMELAGRLDRSSVNRSVLISPEGLHQTVVWSQRSGWEQEVDRHDYDLILSKPSLRRLFADPDVYGPYRSVRSFEAQVKHREISRNAADVRAMQRELRRKQQF